MIGFLFDNDGVLIDSSELHWKSWQLLMEEDPTFFMKHDDFVHGFGKRNDLILKDCCPNISKAEREKWANRKEELFRQIAKDNISLLPGMKEFLDEVKFAKIPRIIASSTPIANLQMFLRSTILGQYFDLFVSAEQVEHGKPAPDVFLAAAKKLEISPQNCIVFEDAPSGIAAGKAAGAYVVALTTTHTRDHLLGYDLLYASPRELNLNEILKKNHDWR